MTKPVDIDQLILVIKNMMPGPRRRGGSNGAQKPLAKDDSSLGPFIQAIDFAATMRRLDYDVQLFQNIIEIFDEDSPRLLEAIESAMANNDANAIRRAAHALRGLAANFEAASLVETGASWNTQIGTSFSCAMPLCPQKLQTRWRKYGRPWRSTGCHSRFIRAACRMFLRYPHCMTARAELRRLANGAVRSKTCFLCQAPTRARSFLRGFPL